MLGKISREEILAKGPFGEKSLFIDEILEISDDFRKAKGKLLVTEEMCDGHFKKEIGELILRGSNKFEAIAQLGLLMYIMNPDNKGNFAELNGESTLNEYKSVEPGDILDIEVELILLERRNGILSGKTYVNGELASDARISFKIISIKVMEKFKRIKAARKNAVNN